jgi:phosphatidylglycerol:prolipoprotein diacylglycerol transferase
MTLAYINWSVKPEIFEFIGLSVRWYGVLFASSFFIGYLIMERIYKNEGVDVKSLDNLTTYLIVATVVGARLGHCLFYEPEKYLADPIEILKVWEGGLASHGAAIGVIIALWLYSRKTKQAFLWTIDRVVILAALAGTFIRLGNLMNSEIFGYQTDVPWAFVFKLVDDVPRHPTQLYEALSYLVIFFFLLSLYYKQHKVLKPGFMLGLFLILVFLARFFIEFLKEPQVGFESDMMLNMGQWLSIPFVMIGLFLVFRKVEKSESQ